MEKQDKLEEKIILYECFIKYLEKYKDNYDRDKYLPQNLIKLYYQSTDDIKFDLLKKSFVKKYIYNENEVEAAHTSWERKGLRESVRKSSTFIKILIVLVVLIVLAGAGFIVYNFFIK